MHSYKLKSGFRVFASEKSVYQRRSTTKTLGCIREHAYLLYSVCVGWYTRLARNGSEILSIGIFSENEYTVIVPRFLTNSMGVYS